MEKDIRQKIEKLIEREIVPATGCTEPIAVAYTAALAAKEIGVQPDEVYVYLSTNVLKNAMGVGIPGTGMVGLPIAISLGIIIADPAKKLNILENIDPKVVDEAKCFMNRAKIKIDLTEESNDKLFIKVVCRLGNKESVAIVEHLHTNVVYLSKAQKILLNKIKQKNKDNKESEETNNKDDILLNFSLVYDYATQAPYSEIKDIVLAAEMNKKASEESKKEECGHGVGVMFSSELAKAIMGDTGYTRIMSATARACDARMGGMPIPVMSNSGSGNQGIAASLPVYEYAKEINASEEQKARAIMLSSLMVIYIKQSLGRLSALCGCVVAATGSACGITYLMGGSKEQTGFAVKNMIANISGMMCDGAKPGCALKVSTGVSSAIIASLMAVENRVVTSSEGIVDVDVDKSIANLTRLGADAMQSVDKAVLQIMTSK